MELGDAPHLGDEQARMNASTRGQWDWYAPHRRAIEKLIVPEGRGGRICVLGAGNCNDLDLKWLAEAYAEVHLVDIDPGALERAVGRQGVGGKARRWKMEDGGWRGGEGGVVGGPGPALTLPARGQSLIPLASPGVPGEGKRVPGEVVLHAPVDLTGIAEVTKGWKGRPVSLGEVEGVIGTVDNVEWAGLGGGYDVVLSPCVLSQLWVSVRDVVGKGHAGWPRLKEAIRARHLRTVAGLLRPGGRGVVVVDLASTTKVKGLDRARGDEVPAVMRMCVEEGKGFRGLEPREMEGAMRRAGLGGVGASAPWVWHLSLGKAFLCYGMVGRRGGV